MRGGGGKGEAGVEGTGVEGRWVREEMDRRERGGYGGERRGG